MVELRKSARDLSCDDQVEAILGCIADGVLVYDAEGRIVRSNTAADEMLGLPQDSELRGVPVGARVAQRYEVWSEQGRRLAPEELPGVRAATRGETVRDFVIRLQAAGRTGARWLRVSASPLRVADEPVGAVVSMTDVSGRKQLELDLVNAKDRLQDALASITESYQALRESERDLHRAQTVARTGSWRLDVRRNELLWSDETHRMFGIPKGTPLTYETFVGHVHPDDRALVDARWRAALRGEPYEVEHRILVGGEVAWVREKAELEFDEDGSLLGGFGTVQDVTEAKQLQEALASANARLVQADRRKDEFLGMLSHELRNPLAPLRNSIHILRHVDAGSEQAGRAQDVIERQTRHLTRLVDDLLDVTRIARGKIELRYERVDLRDVVRRAGEDFRSVLERRDVRFRSDVPDGKVWADADATRLAQLVGNLLHNAAKFTQPGDDVTLSLSVHGRDAEIRVRDTGAGIGAELLPTVFDAFVQGERTLARSEGGLGLGLALVKGIAELHGGTVRAESAGNGHGAEFIVRLPTAEQADAPEPRIAGPRPRNGGRRILVVDDNVDAAQSLADFVELLGHVAEVAFDGPSAIAAARATSPDVVLCDLGLPGVSGYEVAKALRASGDGIRLYAVSGYAQPEDVRRALDSGFDGHLAKPVDPDELERLLV
jgi:PAS domain S-box-containing protein